MNHNKLELADIFRDHGHQLGLLSRNNSKVVNAILDCRTPALGGHLYQCDGCGIQDQSYNSCRNRHCPKCQFTAKREWIEERIKDVLEVPYHHVVFTIPHGINELVITNKALLYSILFKASAKTLKAVFRKKYKSNPGIISVLHTWSQDLSLHPHIHMIIPGGGLTEDGTAWIPCDQGFFLNVRALSKVFRAKFIKLLRKAFSDNKLTFLDVNKHLSRIAEFQDLIDLTFKQDWNVYAKKPFRQVIHVLKYLGGYTHRIAISNHRLVSFDDKMVKFMVRDKKDKHEGKSKSKILSLPTREFMRRFLMHVLPRGLVRIRHYGFLGSSSKKKSLAAARSLIPKASVADAESKATEDGIAEFLAKAAVIGEQQCPHCKNGRLVKIDIIPRPGWQSTG